MKCDRAVVRVGTVYRLLNLESYEAERVSRMWMSLGVPLTVGAGQVLTVYTEPREGEPGYRAEYRTMLRGYTFCEPLSREVFLYEAGLMMVPRAVRLLPWGGLDALMVDFLRPLEGMQLFNI